MFCLKAKRTSGLTDSKSAKAQTKSKKTHTSPSTGEASMSPWWNLVKTLEISRDTTHKTSASIIRPTSKLTQQMQRQNFNSKAFRIWPCESCEVKLLQASVGKQLDQLAQRHWQFALLLIFPRAIGNQNSFTLVKDMDHTCLQNADCSNSSTNADATPMPNMHGWTPASQEG